MTDLSKAEKEKLRKKAWYKANKERLKAESEAADADIPAVKLPSKNVKLPSKKRQETSNPEIRHSTTRYRNYYVLTFLAVNILVSSAILVVFSVDVLGSSPIGWITAILLEVGILSLAVMNPDKRLEYWLVKGCCCFFVVVSFLILHSGNEANRLNLVTDGKLARLNIKLVERLIVNFDNMPSDHTTKKSETLKQAANSLMSTATGDTARASNLISLSNLAIRIVLLMLNLIFVHAFCRQIFVFD